ncbi:MAG: tRNA (N6-isopentenyl adenosine(37)-C2)-methylthiotransferase MiaB [Desulfobulbaceae bacterium]|nr:tRNA (N6-isopentenyl adenosine(37)-C2)-methylthiotransferase MiaB [Desulfobulbaceae bacterium]
MHTHKTPPTRQAYIETFGCQMNERDSEIMGQLLYRAGYSLTSELNRADVVVVNTCSIRGKAEQKAMSLLGRLKYFKKKRPGLIIAVTGCVAQQEGGALRERMNYIDLVIGPQNIHRLPALIHQVECEGFANVAVEQSDTFNLPSFLPELERTIALPHKRFVTIMQGCNNYCTYCVVPYTRGREVSRAPADILAEIRHLIAGGVKEVTLLGQNVNSYGLERKANDFPNFPDLLRLVAAEPGLVRLRFTTSNPKDLSPDLMRCFSEFPNLCAHFHLPVQSGSTTVLQRMNRKYTREEYLEKIAGLRAIRPDIAITTDIIVGFPGESDADFEATLTLLETVRYHGAYSFKYSDRPGTVSSGFTDKVDESVKAARLSRLQSRQQEITLECNREYVGLAIPVMVEGESRDGKGQWSGRSASNLVINFSGVTMPPKLGDIVLVKITEACQNSLRGILIEES